LFFLEKPSFDLSGLFGPLGKKEIRVKAGEPITIDLPINGSPTPTITWTKDGEPVQTGREFVFFMKHPFLLFQSILFLVHNLKVMMFMLNYINLQPNELILENIKFN
jgi:hypothetical protein